jgi:metal-responsive CopG/Arc/MetJ family transcriptional regulator
MVTLPFDLLREVDSTARELKQSRSQLVRQALTDLLQRIKQRQFEELLAEGYRETAEQSAAFTADNLLLQARATEGRWTWDE